MLCHSETAVTVATLLSSATSTLTTGVSSVWTMMTGNPLTSLFVGAAVLSMGFAFFRKVKRAAR